MAKSESVKTLLAVRVAVVTEAVGTAAAEAVLAGRALTEGPARA